MINMNQNFLPHYIQNYLIPTTHILCHFGTRSHLLRQLVLVQVCLYGEKDVCDDQDDIDHLLTPNHVREKKGGSSRNDGALSIPGSCLGDSVVGGL